MATRGFVWGALGAAVVGLAAAGYGVLLYPKHVARAAVDRAFSSLPEGWTAQYGGLTYSVLKDQLILTNVALLREGTRVAASQISLTGLEAVSGTGGSFKSREASVVGISVHGAEEQATVRRIDAVDFAGDITGIAQAFSQAAPGAVILALPHLLSARRLALADYHEAGAEAIGLASLSIEGLGHGDVGALSAEELRVSAGGNSLVVAKMTLAGADIAALQAVFDPGTYTTGNTPPSEPRQLLRSLDWTSVDLGNVRTQLHFDSMQLAGFRGRPFAAAPTAANASDPRFVADIASALSFDSYGLHGAKIGNIGNGGLMSLQGLDLAGYAGGKLAKARIEGFDMAVTTPRAIKVQLGSIELRDADLSRWLRLLVKSGPAAAAARSNSTIEIPYVAASDLAMGAGAAPAFRIASLSSESSYKDGLATRSKGTLRGLEIPFDGLNLAPEQVEAFRAMQLDRLVLDFDGASRWDPEEKRLQIDSFDFGFEGLGSLGMTASVKGFDPERFTPQTIVQAVQALLVERFELRYRDASLVDRLMAAGAGKAGIAPAQFRANLIQQAEANAGQPAAEPQTAQALQQFAQFLRQPKSIVLTLTPPRPLGILEMTTTAPARLPELLGLHVAAE